MNNMIDIEDLLKKVDIVKYISQYVELKYQNGEYIGLSPFNANDTNPSFTVTPGTQLYYDFSISSGGDVINFIEKYFSINFVDALNVLTKYAGYDILKEIPQSLEATKQIKKFITRKNQPKEKQYRVLPDDVMRQYEFNTTKLQAWIDEGIDADILRKYQVRYYNAEHAIVFPIFDLDGKIINIKIRYLNHTERGKQKYGHLHKIGRMDYLYNYQMALPAILDKKELLLFESEKACMQLATMGIYNTLALGTSHPNDDQMQILITLGCDIVICLDKDKNPRNDKQLLKLRRYCKAYYTWDTLNLLGEKDSPSDKGLDVFMQLYDNRRRL